MNIISMISLFGFCIGTAALVIVLSVFNGFEELILGMYNQFDPDIKILPTKGRSFILDEDKQTFLDENTAIADYCKVVEAQALIRYNGKQSSAIIKGVTPNYAKVTGIDSLFLEGEFNLTKDDQNGAVIGMGLARTLGVGLRFVNALVVYAPKRLGQVSLSQPENSFNTNYFFPSGFFAVFQPEIDNQYMLVDLEKAQTLFQYKNELTSIEIQLTDGFETKALKQELQAQLGATFIVQDRMEQKADLYRMFAMEKWITFFIVIFILIIAIFNIVGTLSMLIIEKKNDIKTLQSIGANNQFIQKIFLLEGRMIAFFGAILGLIIGLGACFLQHYFGIIKLGITGQYIVDAYPVKILPFDIALIFVSVVIIGIAAIYFPVKYMSKKFEN